MASPFLSHALPALAALVVAGVLNAQGPGGPYGWSNQMVAFSVAKRSASIGLLGSPPSSLTIDAGSVLTPNAPPNPNHVNPYFRAPYLGPSNRPIVAFAFPGALPSGLGSSSDDVDAMSYIAWVTWERARVGTNTVTRWEFSVTASSTGTTGDLQWQWVDGEAEGDIFDTDVPGLFLPNNTPTIGNVLSIDAGGGDTVGSLPYGLSVLELPRPDKVDGFAHITNAVKLLSFFSLSSSSAQPYGYTGAHVFWTNPQGFVAGGVPFSAGSWIYLMPSQLGLSVRDDLDGLVVVENTVTAYQASAGFLALGQSIPPSGPEMAPGVAVQPGPNGTAYLPDQVFFSVTAGSSIIGTIDPVTSLPINAGDILMPPASPGNPPRIAVRAELLGLRTVRDLAQMDPRLMDDIDALENFPEGYFIP